MIDDRWARLKSALACPDTGGELFFEEDRAISIATGKAFPIRNGKIYFMETMRPHDQLDTLKSAVRRKYGFLYHKVLVPLFSPGYPFNFARYVSQSLPKEGIFVEVGSGNQRIDPRAYTLDAVAYENVDIVCDLRSLPFKENSIDAFVSSGVLEHVDQLSLVAERMSRSTRHGGQAIHLVPFMYPFHASPHDYQRLTHEGAKRMFGPWNVVDQFSSQGPFTLLNLCLAELLSTVGSFGNGRLKGILYLAFSACLSPIKFLDVFFVKRRSLMTMAPTIVTHLRKP